MPSYVEILNSHGITQTQWDLRVYYEYIRMAFWPLFVGKGEMSVIQLKTDLNKDRGDSLVFELVGELEGGVVEGNTTGVGNEGSFQIYTDSVVVDNKRILVRLDDIPMSVKRSGLPLLNIAKGRLARKAKIEFDLNMTTALTDTSEGRVRDRYLYGAVDSNWNATHATALTAVDNTADQLTLKGISKAKRKATSPQTADVPKIMPTMVRGTPKTLEEWYVYVGHDRAIRDLVESDATFTNRQLNIPPESNRNNILFTGRHFKGSHDGVLIYEYEGIPLVSSTIVCSHNLLLGAQAAAYAVGQSTKYAQEGIDLGMGMRAHIHEIRGIQKLVFNESNAQDHGVVHHFTAAIADV